VVWGAFFPSFFSFLVFFWVFLFLPLVVLGVVWVVDDGGFSVGCLGVGE
jgi:hypothetical protein